MFTFRIDKNLIAFFLILKKKSIGIYLNELLGLKKENGNFMGKTFLLFDDILKLCYYVSV